MKRILLATEGPLSLRLGGAGKVVPILFNEFFRRGVRDCAIFSKGRVFHSAEEIIYEDPLPNHGDKKKNEFGEVTKALVYYLLRDSKFARIAKKLGREYDVISCHDYLTEYHFGRYWPEKVVFTNHFRGSKFEDDVIMKHPNYKNTPVEWLFRRYESRSIELSRSLVFPSNGAREIALTDFSRQADLIRTKSVVIYNGVEPHRKKRSPPRANGSLFFLNIANHVPGKNLPLALEFIAALKRQGYNVNLINCGMFDVETPSLKDKIANLKLGGDVEFKGVVEPKEVENLMLQSDALLMTSRTTVFDLAILEAMAKGLLIVATRLEGHVEAIGSEYPLYLEADCTNASEIAGMMMDQTKCEELEDYLYSRLEDKFTLEKMANSYLELFERN